MDIFDEEIIKFWKSLYKNNVRYILVGGYATNIHGYQRFTSDMDIWIEDNHANRCNLRKAFKETGVGDYPMLETMQIIPGWTNFQLNNGLALDLLVDIKGLEGFSFDHCLSVATKAEIEDIPVFFLHINQLIQAKKAINRPKDQLDVAELEKIVELRKQMGLD